ncbi:MAG: hypothetical protein ACN6RF_06100, partial [Stenotrophomonas sp.]
MAWLYRFDLFLQSHAWRGSTVSIFFCKATHGVALQDIRGSGAARHHQLLDLGNGQRRVQALRA